MIDPSENGLFDIPDYEHIEDEAFPPLPPPLSPGNANQEGDPFANGDGEQEGEMSKLPEVPVAKRRTVKRPQPKLDSQRLISERGLPALRTLFDNVIFKGKGHETEDLKVLMQKMENWAHRLYPKLQFEDFIDRLEVLGGKKEVQTCLKRIRLDMPLTHEDFVGNADEAEAEPRLEEDIDPFGDRGFPEDPFIHSTPAVAPAPATLTEEQQRRIELNKQLALERRLARQKLQESQSALPEESSASSPKLPDSQDNQQDMEENTGKTDTPLKQKPAVSQNSPLFDNECDSPAPVLTNGIDDDSD